MARTTPQPVTLDVEDIRALAQPILAERLGPYGYAGRLEIVEEPDFDGEPIVQMTASVEEMVPPRVSIDAGYAVRRAVEAAGDGRLVFFYTAPPLDVVKAFWAERRMAAE